MSSIRKPSQPVKTRCACARVMNCKVEAEKENELDGVLPGFAPNGLFEENRILSSGFSCDASVD